MRIGFVGAGKVGTAFGIYLKGYGYDISGYYSRNSISAQNAAKLTNSSFYTDGNELTYSSDIIFLTVSDDYIETACEALAQKNAFRKEQLVVHMSGALSSEILDSARKKGCFVYSLHPLQAFADIDTALKTLSSTVFSIEGDAEKQYILEDILTKTGNKYFKISTESKALYHASACIFSNYLVTMIEQGLYLLESIGIDRKAGFEAVLPLIQGTIKNIELMGTKTALTGPITRGDTDTIQKHIKCIGDIAPDKLEFYKLMGQWTLELAVKEKLNSTEKAQILQTLLRSR